MTFASASAGFRSEALYYSGDDHSHALRRAERPDSK